MLTFYREDSTTSRSVLVSALRSVHDSRCHYLVGLAFRNQPVGPVRACMFIMINLEVSRSSVCDLLATFSNDISYVLLFIKESPTEGYEIKRTYSSMNFLTNVGSL